MDNGAGASTCCDTDEAFEARRAGLVWQAMKPARYPHAIWRITTEEDIVRALAHARSHDLKVSIVSGGHSYIGHGIQNGTLVLDLSGLKGLGIDAEKRCGWIEPGVRVAEFDMALERAGLAFPIGHDPNVGVVGYLIGGGMGWNPDRWNSMACLNVISAEIILSSGERVVADAGHHKDLFWAVRGAGPNFCGVVTRLHVQLFPRPSVIRKSDYLYSIDALDGVLSWLARMQDKLEEGVELSLSFSNAADGSAVQCAVSIIFFADTEAEAARLGETWAAFVPEAGLIARHEFKPRTFAMLLDEAKGDGRLRRSVESVWTDDPLAAARVAADAFRQASSRESVVYIGLRKHRKLTVNAACSNLERGFVFIDAAWSDSVNDAANEGWVDHMLAELRPYDRGGYVNETDWYRHPERVAKCYSPDALKELQNIISRYDPTEIIARPQMRHSIPSEAIGFSPLDPSGIPSRETLDADRTS